MALFNLLHGWARQRPPVDSNDSSINSNGKHGSLPSPDVSPTPSRKRHTPPPTNDRTAAVVAKRWKAMSADGIKLEEDDGMPEMPSSSQSTYAESTIEVTGLVDRLYGGGAGVNSATNDKDHYSSDVCPESDDGYGFYDNETSMANRTISVRPTATSAFRHNALDILQSIEEEEKEGYAESDSDKATGGAKSSKVARAKGRKRHDPDRFVPTSDDEDEDDYDSDDVVEEDADELQNWDWLFETEPPLFNGEKEDKKWDVDPAELQAYADGVATIAGYKDAWTADERRLHRLLSLRGFHPLLPAAWSRDFLGVPMYPSLFAPFEDEKEQKGERAATVVTNYGSQFHATRALRALFDLQARVSSLRQAGEATHRIGGVVERELRRYIAWAAADSGLNRCTPFAEMPNIVAKEFRAPPPEDSPDSDVEDTKLSPAERRRLQKRKGNRRAVNSLARQVQEFFHQWVQEYRDYYMSLPEFPVVNEEDGGDNGDHDDNSTPKKCNPKGKGWSKATPRKRQLRPPRLLYGFVIVQHAVMLLVVDSGATNGKTPTPRCFADFNLSLGDRWLDASLNVAIPVHLARAAQLRSAKGLALPTVQTDDIDDDV